MKKIAKGTWFHYDHVFTHSSMKLEMLELTQIGEICLEPGFEIAEHPQHCHEISYIISGRGTFLQDGVCASVSAGDLIITPSTGIHAIRASDTESLSFAYTGFNFLDGKFPDQDITAHFQSSVQHICRDHSEIYTHFRKCMDEFYRSGGGSRLITEACLVQIIVWVCRNLENPPEAPNYESPLPNPGQLVYRIQRHIDNNISSALTVNGIADSLGYSPYYISHHFRERSGVTLQSYITKRKIEKSKELIELNRYSFTEIAEKLGYLNLQSFSRVFRKETGMSPSAYLKKL